MFTVTVRDRVMVAHSLGGEAFGPAQRLHGATYVVDAALRGPRLDADGVLVDISLAADALREVLAAFDYRNLDDEETFRGRNSTTEAIAQEVAERLAERLGPVVDRLVSITVTLRESDVAWAAYELTP